ncbi:hypothetical protein K438DRAFT_100371 [Mycena galopus ATCC 62051]|nr:hypothetical protein K438DRAFT_100371 [Mycena galopus ATCC 62051]
MTSDNLLAIVRQPNDHEPMARLPVEISSEIFIRYLLPEDDDYPDPCDSLLLLSICTSWTAIALSTPELWSKLLLVLPSEVTAEFQDFLNGWFVRAKDHPMSISFSGCTNPDPGIMAIIATHAHHIRDIHLPSPSYLRLFTPEATFPCLQSLFVAEGDPGDNTSLSVSEIIQALRSAPNLTECTLHLQYISLGPGAVGDCVHHEHLNELDIKGVDTSSRILKALTSPSLESLDVPVHSSDASELISFLDRSPLLVSLDLHVSGDDWTRDTVECCLGSAPRLVCLELTGVDEFQDGLIDILADTPCEAFLSDLADLVVSRGTWGYPDAGWYKDLATMLSARRETIESFRLEFVHDAWQYSICELEEDDKMVLRGLVEEGMEIDLGPAMNSRFRR